MNDEELKSLLEPLAVEFFTSLLGAEPKTKASEKYYPPEAAKNNAKKVLRWREEYGSEVKGMTQVGWVRARQLASGKGVSLDVVKRMARFNRHRKNAEVAPEYKETPWKDAGYVAWLGWGGTTGIEWAMRISSQQKDVDGVITKEAIEVNSPGQPLSCVMLNVSDELKALQSLLVSHLSKDDLAAKGVEDEPHITIRFGLHTQDADSMIGFANLIQPIRFTVNGVASFSSKEYDVLFLTVDSPELVRFNELLGKLPNTQTHPKYVPHLTLAYVKPGTASTCIAKLPKFDPVESVSSSFVFSNADKKQTTFILGATPETPTVKVSMKTSDECPVCGKKAKGRCRCMIGNQFCENGHDWHTCKVHGVVLGTGHGVRKPNGCTCGGADAD